MVIRFEIKTFLSFCDFLPYYMQSFLYKKRSYKKQLVGSLLNPKKQRLVDFQRLRLYNFWVKIQYRTIQNFPLFLIRRDF